VKFPKTVSFRKAEAKIYGKRPGYDFYRVAGYVNGKRRMASYATYSEALAAAEALAKDISHGSKIAALTPGQANDALAALERLQGFYQQTGRRVSLLAVASEYAEALRKLDGHTLGEAVDGFLATVVAVKRVDLAQAVEQFIASREHKTKAKPGERPQLSKGYAYNVCMWLREFANTFPGTAVCDLNKDLLNAYLAAHTDVGPRSRNVRRIVVTMFLKWSVRADLLPSNHRLLEADGMARENDTPDCTDFYRPAELAALLQNASGRAACRHLLPIIALQGLAGLRLQEAVRLEWADVFTVAGHVEISKTKSKTRQRRLVTIPPALEQWLAAYRDATGPLWNYGLEKFHTDFNALRETLHETLTIPARRNGMRHAFCTYHFALHANENLTAAEAGNSPAMIHAHYKGLATKAEGEQWFNVAPAQIPSNVIPLAAHASA
jgi:integrase